MRLLFIAFSTMPFGANDLLYYRTALRARREGHEIMLSVPDWGAQTARQYQAIEALGIRLHRRPRGERKQNVLARQIDKLQHKLSNPAKQWDFISEFAPDGVIVNDAATYHMLGRPDFARRLLGLGLPFITIAHGNDEHTVLAPDRFALAREFFGAARATLFVAERNMAVAERQLCMRLERGTGVENPPNFDDLSMLPFPAESKAAFTIVARLDATGKGHAHVLEILARPEWRARDWSLTLVGDGPDANYLRELVRFLGLSDRVQLLGHVDDIRDVWRNQMMLLLCSSAEGKPLSVLEAMVLGRPSVVTDVGGCTELIQDGVTGFVAEAPTVASFAQAMERAWSARAQWAEMGRVAHEHALQRLNPAPDARVLDIILRTFA